MKKTLRNHGRPLTYLITNRHKLKGTTEKENRALLIDLARRAAAAGIDLIQIREKDLSPGELYSLVVSVVEAISPYDSILLVNDRADIAKAAGADGAHLTSHSMRARVIKRAFGEEFIVGVSTHRVAEVIDADSDGADFVVFGPIFETESKKAHGSPVGVTAIVDAASAVSIPVIALGGIDIGNYMEVLSAGAAGIAGISLFTRASTLGGWVREIKSGG